MFEALLWSVFVAVLIGVVVALDGSRDMFHPLVFIGPMLAFIYGWMPLRLLSEDGLSRFFDNDQLLFVQVLNIAGIVAFVGACLAAGCRVKRRETYLPALSMQGCRRLKLGGAAVGGVGLLCWLISILNVGGFVNAFSRSYSGGWDDSGYVRDGSLLLLVGVLLLVAVIAIEGPRLTNLALAALFGLPWLSQALLTARRGPTFAFAMVVLMGWYLNRNRRPPAVAVVVSGFLLGWLVLFLVANRDNIYLGSDFDVNTDVTAMVEKSDTGNEYIYGTGAVTSARRRNQYFWMRRYLAQVLVRPIPSSVWPNKYEAVGLPELSRNAGTSEGFGDALGWVGAVGSAPGIIADLWVEVSWLAVVLMALLGWSYGWIWRKAVVAGPAWSSQYVILAALSIYMVMQTMEAVIFRTLLLSIPSWLVWKWALRASPSESDVSVEIVSEEEWSASEGFGHA